MANVFTCRSELLCVCIKCVLNGWLAGQISLSNYLEGLTIEKDMVHALIWVTTVSAVRQVDGIYPVKMKIQPTVPHSELEDQTLILPFQAVYWIKLVWFGHVIKHDSACCSLCPSCHPSNVEVIFEDSLGSIHADGLLWLFHLSSCLGQLVSSVIPHDIGVSRDPLEI